MSDSEGGDRLSDDSAAGVEKEPLQGMVVQGAVRVGNVQSVMDRVDVAIEELVDMEEAMEEVLPSVDHEAAKESK